MEEMTMEEKIKARADGLVKDLNEIQNRINQIEQQMVQLRNSKDQLTAQGLEFQGAIKVLHEFLPRT